MTLTKNRSTISTRTKNKDQRPWILELHNSWQNTTHCSPTTPPSRYHPASSSNPAVAVTFRSFWCNWSHWTWSTTFHTFRFLLTKQPQTAKICKALTHWQFSQKYAIHNLKENIETHQHLNQRTPKQLLHFAAKISSHILTLHPASRGVRGVLDFDLWRPFTSGFSGLSPRRLKSTCRLDKCIFGDAEYPAWLLCYLHIVSGQHFLQGERE